MGPEINTFGFVDFVVFDHPAWYVESPVFYFYPIINDPIIEVRNFAPSVESAVFDRLWWRFPTCGSSRCARHLRQFPRAVGVTCPFSMLRVQVVDQGKSNAVTRVWAHGLVTKWIATNVQGKFVGLFLIYWGFDNSIISFSLNYLNGYELTGLLLILLIAPL